MRGCEEGEGDEDEDGWDGHCEMFEAGSRDAEGSERICVALMCMWSGVCLGLGRDESTPHSWGVKGVYGFLRMIRHFSPCRSLLSNHFKEDSRARQEVKV